LAWKGGAALSNIEVG
jgi:hypothetical protein